MAKSFKDQRQFLSKRNGETSTDVKPKSKQKDTKYNPYKGIKSINDIDLEY